MHKERLAIENIPKELKEIPIKWCTVTAQAQDNTEIQITHMASLFQISVVKVER
jgi:hypothetical protein